MVYLFIDEGGCFRSLIPDDIVEFDDVGASEEGLQDLDLPEDLLRPHGFEDFNDTLLIIELVVALKDLRILASAQFMHDLIGILIAPVDVKLGIVGVGWRGGGTDTAVPGVEGVLVLDI
jgi:hypothetical protein